MPRNATSNYILALSEGYLFPAMFLEIYLVTGPVRVWTGYQPQILAGVVYTGVGSLLSVSTIEDGSSVDARPITVSLSGIDPTLLPGVLSEFQVGLPATIYLGLFSGEGLSLVNAPVVAWQGKTDQPTITVDATTATISINLESALVDQNTPIPYRYTNQDQQLFHPGDLGLSWVNAIQNVPLYWNQTPNSDGNP